MEDDLMKGLSLGDEAPEEENPAPAEDELGGGLSLGEDEEEKPKEAPQPDDVPEKYEIEGENDAFNEAVGKVARELGLSQEKLQKVSTAIDTARDDETYEMAKAWAVQVKQDEEIGDEKFEESRLLAREVFDKYAPSEELKYMLINSGLSNHPDFMRMMVHIGRDLKKGGTQTRNRFPNSRMED